MNMLAVGALAAVAAGGVAYVFIYPLLSGDARAERRQKALMSSKQEGRERAAHSNRREQIAQTLKELEARKGGKTVTIEQRITQAGLSWSKTQFLLISVATCLLGGLMTYLLVGNLFATGAGLVAGLLGVPRWLLSFLKKRRINKFIEELPNAMDVIVRGLRSGLPLADCLRIIAVEAREPLQSEFRAIIDTQALGIPLGDAVAKLYERVPVPETNFFGIVITVQQKSGGNLAETLGNLSKVLRERKKMQGKIKAMSMEAKASAAIIGALPFVVATLTYISSPSYVRLLFVTDAGNVALVGSGFWMLCGILVMKKMINFEH
jgi:tight adherence protein B